MCEWNETKAEYPREKCVHELFEEQVERTPEAVAVEFEDASLSYEELNRRANRLAHYLRGLGVGPDVRVVGICVWGAQLGDGGRAAGDTGRLGVSIRTVGCWVSRRAAELYVGGQCAGGKGADARASSRAKLSGAGEAVPVIDLADASQWKDQAETNLEKAAMGLTPEHLAYVIYTSGSTGKPKGVMVTHPAITRLVLRNRFMQFEGSDRVAFASNPTFDAATLEIWAPLLNGGSCIVIDQEVLLNATEFGEALRRKSVTILWLTVGLFNRYQDLLTKDFSRLRCLIVGGDVLDPRTISRILGVDSPQHLLNGYGPTETTTFATTYEIIVVPDNAWSIPIGTPIANTQVYVLDERMEPVPVGVAGELYIGGAGVARGYWNRPELTAEKFVPDPFAAEGGSRLYRSGDLGRWRPDGSLEFLGRNDDQVKIRGFRVELGEIEARLAEHAGVRDAVVVAREDTLGDKQLVAYYTVGGAEEEVVDAEGLREHLAVRLPEYMVPAAYVRLERMPLTGNGKLDRKALPAPELDAYGVSEYAAPEGEVETTLAAIWAELLHVERVGRNDNFFELGGHSLLVVVLLLEYVKYSVWKSRSTMCSGVPG